MFQLNKKHLRYDTYTSTNIYWIGGIPNGWEVKKIKMFGKTIAGGTPKTEVKEYWDGNIPWLPSGMVQNCVIYNNDNGKYITQKGLLESSTKEIPANSPLVALTGATCANVALLKFKSTANQSVIGLAVNNKNNPEFLYYSFLANRKQFLFYQTGGAQGGINLDNVKNIYLSAPPLSEQEKIATYLDEKTILLDEIIEKRKNQIKLLSEHKIVLINNAITKGLDPKVELKESGVEWIGKVPKHWEVKKMKYIASVCNGSDYKEIEVKDGKYPVFGSGGEFARTDTYVFNKPSVLLGRKGTIDKPLFVIEPFWTVDTMFYTKIFNNTYPKFFYYQCLNINFKEHQSGSAIPSMTQGILLNIHFPIPNIQEQEEIVEYLDKEIKYIDDMVEKIEKSIQLMKEYKTSLISHAVSGKIKI